MSVAPPFSLYATDGAKPTFAEGFESGVSLLKGRKNVVVLTGAGISVACGIPDFRSKDNGLYHTLDAQALGLSCAEELFDIEVFMENPAPFFSFARNLYFPLGTEERVRPSDSHKLLQLLESKKMLRRVYSQNIDGLEELAGVSPKKIVYAHGSLQWANCIKCKRKVTADQIEPAILKGTIPRCQAPVIRKTLSAASLQQESRQSKRPRTLTRAVSDSISSSTPRRDPSVCNGVLKPGVTFFGESLHDNVRRALESDYDKVDALIVIGTSLSVAPISKVIGYLPANIPRILINRNVVHPAVSTTEQQEAHGDEMPDFREDYVFDAYLLGFCDDVTRALARQLFPSTDEPTPSPEVGQLLASLKDEDDLHFDKIPWSETKVPHERVFLFPGAQPVSLENDEDDISYHEVVHCDGCNSKIEGTVRKCINCFDYDLCEDCFASVSKSHFSGEHSFMSEVAGA